MKRKLKYLIVIISFLLMILVSKYILAIDENKTDEIKEATTIQKQGEKQDKIEIHTPTSYSPNFSQRLRAKAVNGNAYSYKELEDGTLEITKYSGTESTVSIPSIVDGKNVTSIGEAAFLNNINITTVIIPNTVTNIGKGAFSGDSNLRNVTIGSKVKKIETYAFSETAITNITIPASVTEMGNYVFYDNLNLQSINVNSKNTNFSSKDGVLFNKNATKLIWYPAGKSNTKYTIPSTVTTLGELCFRKSTKLEQIEIPHTVTTLERYVFSHMPKLKTIKLPSSITSMDVGLTFENCSSLVTAILEVNVSPLPWKMFNKCENLETIDCSKCNTKSTSIGTISECNKLKNFILPQNLEVLSHMTLYLCQGITNLTIPKTVIKIDKSFALYCNNLKTYNIPSGLVADGDGGYVKAVNVTVTGNYYYDKALEALELVNKERKAVGRETLKIDKELTDSAMERALEIGMYFDHNRPTGNSYSSAIKKRDDRGFYSGENILVGSNSAENAINRWMNSSGHRANILNSDYKSIGIGCFEENGIYYWTQIFTSRDAEGKVTPAVKNNVAKVKPIYIKYVKDLKANIDTYKDYNVGDTISVTPRLVNAEWTLGSVGINKTEVKWKSLNNSVLTVDNIGNIKCVGPGTGTIRVSLGEVTKDYILKVYIPIKSISIPETLDMNVGETKKIGLKINPNNTTYSKKIIWSSTGSSYYVSLNGNTGSITALRPGKTTITAKSVNGKTAKCNVTIKAPITGITLNKTSETLRVGNQTILRATIAPYNTTDSRKITWTTSNEKIAKIDSIGIITAVRPGTVTITAKTSNGKTASCRITVPNISTTIPITSVKVSKTSTTIKKGATTKIIATITPANTTQNKAITWTTSNSAVATVNASGIVTGKGNGTAIITAKTSNGKTATCRVTVYTPATPSNPKNPSTQKATPNISYRTHVQNVGWQKYVQNGKMAGTSGRSLRLEGINIKLENNQYGGGISYQTHIQNVGWQKYVQNGAMSGTSGKCLRLEGIKIKLTGQIANYYDVYYRVHCQNIGWLDWAKNGEPAGSEGYSYRLEGIEIRLVKKGGTAPGKTQRHFVQKYLTYQTHVQNIGWQGNVQDKEMSGTSGKSLRLEGIKIALQNKPCDGNIEYRTHVQNIGWQNYVKNGAMSGTNGRSLRLEAIQIRLTGTMAQKYDIYYRVHCQNFGWMGWAKNGQSAGSAGYCYRLEGIQICLVEKGKKAPGSITNCFRSK